VHGTGVYSARVGPKGPALERFLDIKKKNIYIYIYFIGYSLLCFSVFFFFFSSCFYLFKLFSEERRLNLLYIYI
jgi:hypothetical protein